MFMWQHLLVRHTLVAMHHENHICENLLKIIFGEKDTLVVQKDMEDIGIWLQLWLQQVGNGSFIKPTTPYVMFDDKKKVFLHIIKKLIKDLNKLCNNFAK